MAALLQDLRYGARALRKQPGFTVVAVVTLALGIGANTAIFSVINAVLLRSLPYREPDRMVLVWGHSRTNDDRRSQVSFTDVADFRAQNRVFEEISAFNEWRPLLTGGGAPERVPGMQVSDGYFRVMRGTPLLGRVFTPEEQEEGKDFVVVLSFGLWQRQFGSDPQAVGRTILLNGRSYMIVGVMPADFRSLPPSLLAGPPAELYRPVAEKYDDTQRDARHLRAIARLKDGVTLRQAQTELNLIAGRIEQEHPETNTRQGVNLVLLHEDMVGGVRPALLLLLGAVALVLLIACANVANLLLARATVRQREIAIRAALGAGRGQLMRVWLAESVWLALLGGALGVLLAVWGIDLIEALGARLVPMLGAVEIDRRVLGFTLLVSLLAGVIFGLAPAAQFSRPDLNEALKDGGGARGGAGRNRLRDALVVAEVALALVLLAGAGLLVKSVLRLREVRPGFEATNVIKLDLGLPRAKYAAEQYPVFFARLIERLTALPGVEAAGVTSVLPLSENFDGRGIEIEEHPRPKGEELSADMYVVSPDYLRTMKIALLAGRALGEQDRAEAPAVALVSERMAQQIWPGEDAVGKRFKIIGEKPDGGAPWRTVVGVAREVKQYRLDAAPPMQFYVPQAQFPSSFMTLVVRTASEPAAFLPAIRREIQALDRDQVPYDIATMGELVTASIALRRFAMLLLGMFAAAALLLATIGIYGVMSYAVAQRRRELGIRMALGAQAGDVVKLVIGQGLALTLIGVGIGLALSFVMTRLMQSLLYGVSATDPLIFTLIALLLAGVALVACYLPARRAAKVDPMIALRQE